VTIDDRLEGVAAPGGLKTITDGSAIPTKQNKIPYKRIENPNLESDQLQVRDGIF
jgi:hypothetical protein